MATINTHVVMHNGGERSGFLSDAHRSYQDQIRREISLLDGDESWAWTLFRAPVGVGIMDIELDADRPLLQLGGSAQAMTVEVFYREDDDRTRHYIVGKPDGDYIGEPTVPTVRQGNVELVYPNEAFTADEAAEIAYAYFLNDRVPDAYKLRPFSLTVPRSAHEGDTP